LELILLRHGDAEDVSPAGNDAERSLTEQGSKKLSKALPGLKTLIEDRTKVRIWTSPLKRAVQTAAILADCLGVESAELHPELEHGEWPVFIQATKQLDDTTCLILVGHEPHWGQWSERLGGTMLPFKKGAAAGFEFDPSSWNPLSNGQAIWKGQGQLQWFVQPRVMKSL
jgi:phosphohistidine phosphatase SixA